MRCGGRSARRTPRDASCATWPNIGRRRGPLMLADQGLEPGPRAELGSRNAFKLGLFAANCSGSRILSAAPEAWSGSWEDNLALARLCDRTGIEFLVPVGRWKGYGGDTDARVRHSRRSPGRPDCSRATKRLTSSGPCTSRSFTRSIAAKQMVTADHVGRGRFGLNIVSGWNEDEFEMFGVDRARTTTTATHRRRSGSTSSALAWERERLRLSRQVLQPAKGFGRSRSPTAGRGRSS